MKNEAHMNTHYYKNMSSSLTLLLCLSLLLPLYTPASPNSPFSPDSPSPNNINTFDFVNTGPFNRYPQGEYGSTYRRLPASPDFVLTLAFYNTTPNTYYLALGPDPNSWVWVANPNESVHEGAKLSFKKDGNLVLVDFDNRLVWQTNTSNKGVVGFRTPTDDQYGNLVLYDCNNKTVWQTFDHPTDTLFANQYFGPTRLVSRVSPLGGYHSLVVRPHRLSLYYKSSISKASKPVVYYTLFKTNKTLDHLEFIEYNEFKPSFNQYFTDGTQGRFEVIDLSPLPNPVYHYDIEESFIRLENDGDLRVHVFQRNNVDDQLWYSPYGLFALQDYPLLNNDHVVDTSCFLPEKCGAFGVCDDGTCVSCPTPQGPVPWTAGKCAPPKLGGVCKSGGKAKYYKVEGVEHFSSKFNKGEGIMPLGSCQTKCNLDCKCVGYFYHQETKKCWIAHDLMTLTKSTNPDPKQHLGFIKMSNY